MFRQILNALVNLICGSSEPAKPPQEQHYPPPQHQYPPQHQPVPHKPSHQQHQQQPVPHKPAQQHHKPSSPPHRPSVQKYEDANQANQHNEWYMNLRAQANQEGDSMARCFERSHQAYASGDKAGAKTLSNEGKEHQRKMESLHKQASDWIFIENNKDSRDGEIDLHGLYVKEAIERTDLAIEEAKRSGRSELHLITGKGLHSKGGVAKLKPAIEDLMRKHQLQAELDPHNAGVLIVQINSSRGRGVGADEITRRLEKNDEGCVIM